jgi:diguanylate cyclase (GGDEF)-like protein
VRLRSNSKIWVIAVVCLVIAQAVASMLLPKCYRLTAITDWITLALMLSAALAFARNAFGSDNRRQRLVWILLGAGYAVEVCGQILWMHWELVVKKTPVMSLGDACIFLAWTAVIMGFALRPHVEPTPQHQRLGTFDLLLLLLAGLYLYLFLVIPWQYLAPEPQSYTPAYTFLALAQDVILLSIVVLGWRHSSGRWRHFYALLSAIVAFDTVMEYVVDTLPAAVFFSGGWYDTTTAAGIAGMTLAALMVYRLEPVSEREDPDSERYWWWASRLAAPFTLVLPLLAAWSFLDRSLPVPVWQFRVFLSLAAVVVFASVGIVKQARLEKELANANRELLDASLTDLLTGVRNRRFFTSSIEADVQHVLRSFADYSSADVRNRDLVFYLIDIDHFKKVNDQFGHKIGDQVLAEVARRINSAARLSDAVIRWGGEEFLLLSRYTDRKEAHILANRILDSVGSKPYRVEASKLDLRVTCSLGWAVFPWTESDPKLVSHDQVLVLADFALYQAKGSGRNRAVGLLPAGQTVRAGIVAPTIYINGIPASPVTTPGPSLDSISTPGPTTPSANTAAASAT